MKQQLPGTGVQNSTLDTLTVSPENKALDETGLPTDPCVTDVKCVGRVCGDNPHLQRLLVLSTWPGEEGITGPWGLTRGLRSDGSAPTGTAEPTWGTDYVPGRVALTSLALVKATPEKAYLSTTRVMPWLNFSFINGLQERGCL